ncbi:MAG: pantoate--beta-alanine ligase [Oscillospiraceae bacterium]|nr:pantoate--beta-alanine ligase [Oscillospiraceae bacterium]MBQ9111612.1 pantoate--beta-alanine ligase [Oscillospiraceae bacterium]
MKIVETIAEVRAQVKQWRQEGLTVGFVPTMGYLHEGHLSLIERARRENDRVAVSIFVNPTQFGPNEDLASYPRDLEHDAALCEGVGTDLIFHPEPAEMYPEGFCSYVDMDVLTQELCGLSRPVHFRGVCTVVSKLFHIVQPDRAYFGEKDAQQLAVIKRMVQDLNMDLEVIGCPIVREEDGLAKSSRNTYLSPEERRAALVLSRSIAEGRKLAESGETDAEKLVQAMRAVIAEEPLARIDYVKVVDLLTMQQISRLDRPFLAAMAVYIGKTRLIDNFMMETGGAGTCC